MSRYFAFRWHPFDDRPLSVLVIASATSDFEKSEVTSLLDADHLTDLYPDRILLLHPRIQSSTFAERAGAAFGSGTLLRFENHVSIHMAAFGVQGSCDEITTLHGVDADWPDDAFAKLKTRGLREIFERRGVLMRPGPGLHFKHPSGVHSRSFLRGANAFVNGAETMFVAMTLLRHLGAEIKQIWLDSSSIASVAYAMTSLRQRFEPLYVPPHIESFSSYEGLRKTSLTHGRRALVLISATASGGMAREISERHGVDPARVVNLFSAAHPRTGLTVHCDVHEHASTRTEDGDTWLRFVAEDGCPWCRDGSRLVRFVSDQFLADAMKYADTMIVEKDAPDGLGTFFGRFHGGQALRLKRRERSDLHRFWLDLNLLKQDQGLLDDVGAATRRFVPVSVTHVIHLDDCDSEWLASAVAEEIRRIDGKTPAVVNANATEELGEPGAVVVAAACIGSGNALQMVSRDLRDALKDRPRAYVVGFAKQAEGARLDRLTADLVHNKSHRHDLVALNRLALPDQDLTAWARELRLVRRLLPRETDASVTAFLEARFRILSQDVLDHVDDLFLRSAGATPLKLSEGFAFWPPDYKPEEVAQGDVLATIAAVLHNMRVRRPRAGLEPKLASNAFHTVVLNPGVFGRFNDGIIQASILRAAHPHELNYGSRPDLSSAMLRIVQRSIERWQATRGEACLEFLLALATRRLVLTDADMHQLREDSVPREAPEVLRMFVRVIQAADSPHEG